MYRKLTITTIIVIVGTGIRVISGPSMHSFLQAELTQQVRGLHVYVCIEFVMGRGENSELSSFSCSSEDKYERSGHE